VSSGRNRRQRRSQPRQPRSPGWVRARPEGEDSGAVIITIGDSTPPREAGELLGTLREEARTDDGTVLPRGSSVYADRRPPAAGQPVQAATLHFSGIRPVTQPGPVPAAEPLPGWAQGRDPAEEISIIFATGDDPAPPEGAGDLLGVTKVPGQTADGTPIPAGARVYRSPYRLSSEDIQADPRATTLTFGEIAPVPASYEQHHDAQGPRRIADELGWPDPATARSSGRREDSGQDIPAAFRKPGTTGPLIPPDYASSANQAFAGAGSGRPRPPLDVSDELAARLGRGLTPEEMSDPEILKQIAQAGAKNVPGAYSFGMPEGTVIPPEFSHVYPQGRQMLRGEQPGPLPGLPPGEPPEGVIAGKLIVSGERTDGGEGMPDGTQVGDIIAAEQPLGYVDTGITLPDGTSIEPGARVWRADPGTPSFARALAAGPHGQGGPDAVVSGDRRAIEGTDADLVIEDLDPDDPDDPGRVLAGTPEQIRAYHRAHEEADRRAQGLIPGTEDSSGLIRTREAAEGVWLRATWPADAVLDQHAWLVKHYQQPGDPLADYLAFHMRNSLDQDHRTASMYWPIDLRGAIDIPQGTELAHLIARGLAEAGTYQVTAPMCTKMREEWDARTPGPLILDEGEMPAPAGFAWLDRPWLSELSAGYWLPVRAVSWERTVTYARSERGGAFGLPQARTVPVESVRLVLWLLINDDVAFGRWKGHEARAARVANLVGQLVPQQVALLPFGSRISTGERFRTNGETLLSLVHSLWRFLGMELARSRRVTASAPATRRRVARSLRHDTVHIITLRKVTYIEEPAAHFPRAVDWQCRWWVEEFYRHIDSYTDEDEEGRPRRHKPTPAGRTGYVTDDDHDVCAVCLANGQTARISLVRSFLKGPSDKPLRTPARGRTIHRLSR